MIDSKIKCTTWDILELNITITPSGMKHVSYEERKMIEEMLLKKKTHRDIGKYIGRDHTVIDREINRHKGYLPYSADRAQLAYERDLKNKRPKKLNTNRILRDYVVRNIMEDWSPEEIAGRLKKYEYRVTGDTVSHETMYQFIYSKEGRELRLAEHLRTGRGRRRTWSGRAKNKILIPERISIHQRPIEIETRKTIGHWESDNMIFSNQKPCLSVETERKSRYCSINKTENKSSDEKLDAMKRTIDDLPEYLFRTITFDNGSENVKHIELRDVYEILTFFCDTYCSWQKGTVENTNKLIRQYFPRYINMNNITEERIKEVQGKLNNRPRKCLDYLTPKEVLLGGAFIT